MWIPNFVINFIGHKLGTNLEDKMDGTKPWYTSKNLWSNVVSGLIGIYLSLIAGGVHLPAIPPWIVTILSAIGVYTRVIATDKLTT